MKKNKEKIYGIAVIILMIDQFIKLLISNNMKLGSEIKVIDNFFSLFYLKNTGAAFSILDDKGSFLIIISVIILVIVDRYIAKESKFSKLGILSFGIVIGGIVGNLVDRLLYHGVIDYLSFNIFGKNFPVFNIADTAITIGIVLIIIDIIRGEINDRRRKRI